MSIWLIAPLFWFLNSILVLLWVSKFGGFELWSSFGAGRFNIWYVVRVCCTLNKISVFILITTIKIKTKKRKSYPDLG